MPELGETVLGKAIGYADGRYAWTSCELCGRERWVRLCRGIPEHKRCNRCARIGRRFSAEAKKRMGLANRGARNHGWKGGRSLKHGYIYVAIYPEDEFHPMANSEGRVAEHRLVMARHLGRCLLKSEHVHHKDGIGSHNELSNLELISPSNHIIYKQMCADCELRKEIRLLRWQLKELASALQEKLRQEI